MVDGGFKNERGFLVTLPSTFAARKAPTRRLFTSIRPVAIYNGLPNEGEFAPERVWTALAGPGIVLVELVLNPVLLGTPVWVEANPGFSVAEISHHDDPAAGGFTNGVVAASWFVTASGTGPTVFGDDAETVLLKTQVGLQSYNILKHIGVAMTALAGTPDIFCSLTWRERHPPF